MLSGKPLARMMCSSLLLSFALSLSACATSPSAPKIPVPQTYRDPCERPRGSLSTDGEVAAFVVRQELALADCEARRRELVGLIDQANEPSKKRRLLGLRVPF